jgi:hypothetical protein
MAIGLAGLAVRWRLQALRDTDATGREALR